MRKEIVFTLNGEEMRADVEPHWTLLYFLREVCEMTGTKEGCGYGECGACTVIVDGKAINSCLYPILEAEGKNVITVEGLVTSDGALHPLQKAFIDNGAVQCGFCTPGIIMSALALLNTGRRYTREELRREISGHLCRCTGYENILNALEKVIGPEAKPCCSSATDG